MTRFRARLGRSEEGTTLIELLVTMAMFAVILIVAYSVLFMVQTQTSTNLRVSDAVGQAKLALAQIDRQVRSGNVLYSPAGESTAGCTGAPVAPSTTPNAGNCMRVYTQANGDERCVQWEVVGGVLKSRSWSTTWQTDGQVTEWRTVARGIVNVATSQPPFVLQGPATNYGSRLVDIHLQVQPTASDKPILVQSSLSGRNTLYGFDPGVCNAIPS
jgi:type II secretory pathway component PulJ